MNTDQIQRSIEIQAPRSRVWRALTDANEFGTWFRAKLDGAFVAGKSVSGHITYPGFEHLKFEADIERMEPEHTFSLRWHPYAIDPEVDYSGEPQTLVEFHLEDTERGTRLTVTESGFDRLPSHRRDEAFRMNDGGWAEQLENIRKHAES